LAWAASAAFSAAVLVPPCVKVMEPPNPVPLAHLSSAWPPFAAAALPGAVFFPLAAAAAAQSVVNLARAFRAGTRT
jgi:hypothetical protein